VTFLTNYRILSFWLNLGGTLDEGGRSLAWIVCIDIDILQGLSSVQDLYGPIELLSSTTSVDEISDEMSVCSKVLLLTHMLKSSVYFTNLVKCWDHIFNF
jgi:hypothetical protein